MGSTSLKNNGDEVAIGKDAKTNLLQSVSGNLSSIYAGAWDQTDWDKNPVNNIFVSAICF